MKTSGDESSLPSLKERILRHARITWKNYANLASPPFLILFINSFCNQVRALLIGRTVGATISQGGCLPVEIFGPH
jgi:hypothetical protein